MCPSEDAFWINVSHREGVRMAQMKRSAKTAKAPSIKNPLMFILYNKKCAKRSTFHDCSERKSILSSRIQIFKNEECIEHRDAILYNA